MNIFKFTSIAFFVAGTASMTGCLSDEASSPAMPVNSRIIDLSNAKATYDEAINTTDNILAKDSQTTLAINDIFSQIRNNRKNSGQDSIARATFDHNISCISGSGVDTGSEVSDGLGNGNGSGSATFDSCETESNIVLNGTLSFDYSWETNGDRRNNLSGNISITRLDTNITIQLNGLAISEESNDLTNRYVISVYQYTYDPGTDGFTVQTAKEIKGQEFTCGPSTGIIIINGGGGTRLRATYRGNRSLTIEVNINNGPYAEVADSPFICGL